MDPVEAVAVEAQTESESRSLFGRIVLFFAIAAGAVLLTIGVGIVAATYYVAKDPDLVLQLISERTGYYIQVERIAVSLHGKGPQITVGNVTAEGEYFAADNKLVVEEAEIILNLWAIVGLNTPLVENLLLRGVHADLTDILRANEAKQDESWNPRKLFELPSSFILDGKLGFIRSVIIEDASLAFAKDSEAIDIKVPNATLVFEDRSVNLSARLIPFSDEGSLNITSHVSQDKQAVFTANGSIIGNAIWIPLPFLDKDSSETQLNSHSNLTERHGFKGSVIDQLSIPFDVLFSSSELSINANNFSVTHSSFRANGSASFDMILDMLEPSFNIDIKLADTDPNFALAVLPGSLLGVAPTKEIQRIVRETTVSKAHLYIAYPEIIAENAAAESLRLSASAKSRSIPLPSWPSVGNATVDLELNRNSLSIDIHSADYAGIPVENATFNISSFEHPTRMRFHVPLDSRLENIKAMLLKTPLAADVAKFDACRATGNAKGTFEGDFDLEANIFKIKSDAVISGATVSCNAVPENIIDLNAHIHLDNSSFKIEDGHGRIGSDPVNFEVTHLVGPNLTTAKVKGVVSAGLLHKLGLPQSEWISGKTAFEMSGNLTDDAYELSLSSPTSGLAIKLPGLPGKGSSEPRKLYLKANGEINGSHFVSASWGQALHTRLTYFSKEKDPFRRFGGYVANELKNDDIKPGIFLFGLPNFKGEVKYLMNEALWKLDFQDVDLSDFVNQTSNAPTAAISGNAKRQIENSDIDPRQLPSFHLYCKNMRLGQNIGEVEIYAERERDGLKISQFDINMGVISIYNSNGSWRIDQTGKHKSEVSGQVKIRDGGHFLKGLGVANDIVGIKGDADFAASWPGAPHQVTPATLVADANVSVRSIVIEKSRGDLLRLIDLVTLNAINVVGGDLNIDRIDARLTYRDGLVSTEDATVELPSAHLAIAGSIKPLDQTVDSRVILTLKVTRIINAIGLAIANPFLGLGYIGYEKTSSSSDSTGYLDRLTRHTYKVIGKWSDPKIAAEGFRFLPGI